jgi:hypothetical protein
MARRTCLSVTELLRLAAELDTVSLTLPQQPDDEMHAAVRALQAACNRVAALCLSPCHLLALPSEALLCVLRECTSRELAALGCSCHALTDGPSSLIDRGARDAISHQFGAELGALPPKGLRAQARLRWLERAHKEAQHWLQAVRSQRERSVSTVLWPKVERSEESCWIEAVVRFGGRGRDLTVVGRGYTSDMQGDLAKEGMRAALRCLEPMARRQGRVTRTDREDAYHALQSGDYHPLEYPPPACAWYT